jgi:hypothetical protein
MKKRIRSALCRIAAPLRLYISWDIRCVHPGSLLRVPSLPKYFRWINNNYLLSIQLVAIGDFHRLVAIQGLVSQSEGDAFGGWTPTLNALRVMARLVGDHI